MNTEVQKTSGTMLHLLFTADVWNGLVTEQKEIWFKTFQI